MKPPVAKRAAFLRLGMQRGQRLCPCSSFVSEGGHSIDSQGAAGGEIAGRPCGSGKEYCYGNEGCRIGSVGVKKQTTQAGRNTRQGDRCGDTHDDACHCQTNALAHDEAKDIGLLSA
jgi:hypothetical protein